MTQVNVAYAISMKTTGKRVHNGKRVRFSGVVVPAHDGAVVQVEKRGKGGIFRIVGRTLLKHSLPTQSTYSKRVRIHRTGVFRVHTLAGPDHADGFSAPKRIRVP